MVRITHIASVLVLLLAGCGGGDANEQPLTEFGALSPGYLSSAVPSAAVDDPPGAITCGRLADALSDAALMDPGVVDGIAETAVTADAPVADAARRLADAYAAAVAADGAENEPDAVAAVSAAAADMAGVCADSGLQPSVG